MNDLAFTKRVTTYPHQQIKQLDPNALSEMARPKLEGIIKTFKDAIRDTPDLAKNTEIIKLIRTAEVSLDTMKSSLPADKNSKTAPKLPAFKGNRRITEQSRPTPA